MLINSVRLFKTPLDVEHTKIIDFIGTLNNDIDYDSIYFDKLVENYQSTDLIYPLIKSIIIENGRSVLTLPSKYLDIYEYNYCCIVSENKYYYFNTIDFKSLNDNDINPSTMITIEWDYWANNISNIYKNITLLDDVNIEYKHIERMNSDKSFNYYCDDDLPLKHSEIEIPLGNNIKPLFVKMVFNDSMIERINVDSNIYRFKFNWRTPFTTIDDTSTVINGETYNVLTKSPNTNLFTVYGILGLVDVIKQEFVKGYIFNSIGVDNRALQNSFVQQLPIINNKDIRFHFDNTYAEYIQSIELTYNSPYDYTIGTHNDGYYIDTLGWYSLMFNGLYLSTKIKTPLPILISGAVTLDETNAFFPQQLIQQKEIDEYVINYQGLLLENYERIRPITPIHIRYEDFLIGTDINQIDFKFTPNELTYPLLYFKIYFNGNEYILSPNGINLNNIKIQIINKTCQPSLRILYNTKDDSEYKYYKNCIETPILSTGLLSQSQSRLAEYFNANSNKFNFSFISNAINSIKNIGKPMAYNSPSMFGVAVDEMVGLNLDLRSKIAMIKDLENQPDIIRNYNFAEYDLFNQDRIRLTVCSSLNTISYQTIIDNIYKYGNKVNINGNPFINVRTLFDFVKTNNCKLPLPINNDDREKLEKMLNNGVHKFHIDLDGTSFKSSLSTITNQNNIEYNLLGG